MAKSSFWCSSLTCVLALTLAAHSAEPPAAVEVRKSNGAGGDVLSLGTVLDAAGLLVTVSAAAEPGARFFVGPVDQPAKGDVALHEPKSRVLLLRTEKPAAPTATLGASRALPPLAELKWSTGAALKPARVVGPIKSLDGKALLLTLLRVNFSDGTPQPGTPLLDSENRVVALALSALDDDAGGWLTLPVEAVQKVATDFANYGRVQTGRLEIGVAIGTTTPRIELVKPGQRGEKAGLRAGDVILRLGSRDVSDCFDVLDANFHLDSRVETPIRILRGQQTLDLTAPADE